MLAAISLFPRPLVINFSTFLSCTDKQELRSALWGVICSSLLSYFLVTE